MKSIHKSLGNKNEHISPDSPGKVPAKITNYTTTNNLDKEVWKQGDLWVHIYIYNLISITKMVNLS